MSTEAETVFPVELAGGSYSIRIGSGLLGRCGEIVAEQGLKRVFVLSDRKVASLYLQPLLSSLSSAGLEAVTHIIPVGERSKSFRHLQAVLETFLEAGAERDDVIFALGGGVSGDLAGLAAGLLKRGCRVVQIPTSLLAQVDSSIGGKTAINSRHGKNLIGLFHQPDQVLIDLDVLRSLPRRHLRAGLAEIVKVALICDLDFARELYDSASELLQARAEALAPAIERACRIKARIVASDERERGERAFLNLGHTFGHALEAANGYRSSLLHGEAVGCGLGQALRYSERLGFCSGEAVEQGEGLLEALGLQHRIPFLSGGPYESDCLLDFMAQDKKSRGGVLTLVLLRGIGEAFLHTGADFSILRRFLDEETGNGRDHSFHS